jgi:glycosyltransferase involved in cell wall biosynthesis
VTTAGPTASVRPRRVVMVEPTPGMRGPQRTMLTLARYLAPRVPLVEAIPEGFVSKAIRAGAPDAEILSLPFHGTRAASWLHGAASLMSPLGREGDGILIHANGLSALNLAGPLARRVDAPVLVHFHACEITARSRAFLGVWQRLGVRMVFHPVSTFSRGLLEAVGVRTLVRGILPNPIEQTDHHAQRPGPQRPFRVGWIGSKAPRKGLRRVIQIASLLRDEPVEWHLYGVALNRSRTPYVNRCLDEIAGRGLTDRIRWCGKVEDTRSAYDRMDALLLPSERESFARVAIEAMARGVPVVASRVGGVPEAVRDGASGLLFDPGRLDEAATHLRSLVHDPALWLALSSTAFREADRFDVTTVGPMLERFYGDMFGNGNETAASSREGRPRTATLTGRSS